MKKKNIFGFSLIELLVVVAIIGALAAIGTLSYSGYTSSAKKSAIGTNDRIEKTMVRPSKRRNKNNLINKEAILESLMCFKRAGASAIVSYFALDIVKRIKF